VKEINEGKTLKGSPAIGTGGYGASAQYSERPPTIGREGTSLPVVDDGGPKD